MSGTRDATARKLDQVVACLVEVARACTVCGGKGEVRETFEARILTDDPRHARRLGYVEREAAVKRRGPVVEPKIRGAGILRSPCPGCRRVRQVIEICGGSI